MAVRAELRGMVVWAARGAAKAMATEPEAAAAVAAKARAMAAVAGPLGHQSTQG